MNGPDNRRDISEVRGTVREEAHAKINLTLEVIGKRGDGFHNLVSIIQTIDMHDVLTVEGASELSVTCDDPEVPIESNLALAAAEEFCRFVGERRGARIHISKKIPVAAGLGGGSADAAATLRALNRLWKTGLSSGQLQGIGAEVGSDVPVLIDGGTALVQGRGEDVKPLPTANLDWLLVASPTSAVEGKTALMFSHMDRSMYTRGVLSHKLAGRIIGGKDVPEEFLFNVFQPMMPDVFPDWSDAHDQLVSLGAREVFLSGAGPTMFAIPPSREIGVAWQLLLQQRGVRAHLARPWWPNSTSSQESGA